MGVKVVCKILEQEDIITKACAVNIHIPEVFTMCHSQLVLCVMMLELDKCEIHPQPNMHILPHHFLAVTIVKLEKLRFRSNTATR
jgi:hypothetical protein